MTDTEPRRPLTPQELDKIAAEAEAARADARHKLAQARKMEADAHVSELAATKANDEDRARRANDEHHHVYRFDGTIDGSTVNRCMAKLSEWHRLNPECDIEIIFNSPGGGVIAGMALFDHITALSKRGGGPHHVTIGSQGYAASMAGILLQAGDHRWVGRQSYLMIHEISAGTGGKIGEIKDDVKFYEAICARVVDIFVDRSGGKCSKARFTKGWVRTDWWLLSDEALKLGFVDEVR